MVLVLEKKNRNSNVKELRIQMEKWGEKPSSIGILTWFGF